MTTRTATPPKTTHRVPRSVAALIGLLVLLAIGAIQGGLSMVTDPLEPLGLQVTYLERTPVDTYLWPGIFLLGIAFASLVTVAGLSIDWRWRWALGIETAAGYRWPWLGALATGFVIFVFEVLELFFVPFHPVMHPLLLAWSVAIIWLTLTTSTRHHLQTPAETDQDTVR